MTVPGARIDGVVREAYGISEGTRDAGGPAAYTLSSSSRGVFTGGGGAPWHGQCWFREH